jgi:hypothetical protein
LTITELEVDFFVSSHRTDIRRDINADRKQVALPGLWEPTLWQTHCGTLLNIIAHRRQVHGREQYGFLVWTICLVDLYALLGGSGQGDFVRFILARKYLSAHEILPALGPHQPQTYFQEELPYFPAVLEMHLQVVQLATIVGDTARSMQEEMRRPPTGSQMVMHTDGEYAVDRKVRAQKVQQLCYARHAEWESMYRPSWTLDTLGRSLPPRVRAILEYVSTNPPKLCSIYSQVDSAVLSPVPRVCHLLLHKSVPRADVRGDDRPTQWT